MTLFLGPAIFVETWRDFVFLVYYAPLLFLVPYVLGPILVKFTQKMPRSPHFDECDFEEITEGMSGAALEFFTKSHESLSRAGFESRAFLLQSDQIPGVSVALRLYEEPEALDYVAVILILAKTSGLPEAIHQSCIEFSTRFATGEAINTNNRSDPDSFPQPDSKDVFRCPILEDPGQLYEVHKARLERRTASEKIKTERGKEAESVVKSMVEESEWAARLGYYSLSGENYVPTWKGALLMTWRQLWPLKHLQVRKFRAQARSFVEEMGLSGDSDS